MLKQRFAPIPQGIIKSGYADYEIDETKVVDGKVEGVANYDLIAGVWVFTKELSGQAAFKIDPKQLLSVNVIKGKILRVSDIHMTVLDVANGVASVGVALASSQGDLSGIVTLDVSKEYLSIMTAKISGKVLGYDVTLEITPV
jgi:hypothetical protein